jgi:nucleoside-diphosphate-sugar epimerase
VKVLVTGGRGLLGAATVAELEARGHDVTTFQRGGTGHGREILGDVTDATAVHRAVAGHDAVVHLAARVSMTGEWRDFLAVNVEGTRHVVDACLSAGVSRLVYVSSPSVAHAGEPLIGVGAQPADPDHARGNYARSKAMAELIALAANSPELIVTAIRPHLVWGPGDTQLVERIIDRARSGRLFLIDRGQALIDTTYVDNAADALACGVERGPGGQALVVSNGEPRTVAELVMRIARAGGAGVRGRVPYPVAHVAGAVVERAWGDRPGEPPITAFLAEQLATAHWFDQRRTRAALGWVPRVSLDEGFRRLEDAYRSGAVGSRPAGTADLEKRRPLEG